MTISERFRMLAEVFLDFFRGEPGRRITNLLRTSAREDVVRAAFYLLRASSIAIHSA